MARVYEYDVFISYQRTSRTVPLWIKNHFYPRLSESLDDNADFEVKIFYDEETPFGVSWPMKLRGALMRTRIVVAVCSPKYFLDEWCLAEWHSMAQREEMVGLGSVDQPEGLIYPVIFSDSENFPQYAKDRRMRSCREWNQPEAQLQASVAYREFRQVMEKIATDLLGIIERAPEWCADWPVRMPRPDPPRRVRLPRF
jgi:hypothetical protein